MVHTYIHILNLNPAQTTSMGIKNITYEALTPLSGDSPDTSPPSISAVVFRNEISVSSPDCRSPDTAVQDYFSLDFAEEDEEKPADMFSTPVRAKAEDSPPARLLESGWFRANCGFKSPMLQLHKEILDFCDFLSPTRDEQDSRNAAVERVSDVIQYIWPTCKVEVFGSFKTGLYLPTSDIDVVILESNISVPQKGLQALARALSQRGVAKKIQVIGKARVPIIKFVEKKSGVSFDVSFDAQNGPKAAEFIKDAMFKWPSLRPLCLILKVFLQQRQLNEVYSGGIGSYALLTMLMAMLQSLREVKRSTEQNLGVLLVIFFDIYGRKLNTSDVGVSCNGSGTFFLKSSRGFSNVNGRGCLISIEDPQAPENDIGKGSFAYYQVKSAFSMALSTLTNTKTVMSLGPNRSILGTIIRPDPVLLERKGGTNGDVTFNELLPGAGEPTLDLQSNNQQDIYCNWQSDDEEEPLPRGNTIDEEIHTPSAKKLKKRKQKQNGETVPKKKKRNGDLDTPKKGGSAKTEKHKARRQKMRDNNGEGSNSRRFKSGRRAGLQFNQSA